jgi:hypothetical protein
MKWLTSVFGNPIGLVLTGAAIAVCLSSYPIIFLGKSYVSPGYGPQMLYDSLPYVPGYQSTDKEVLPADPGAMPWQNLPYSRVQHQAVFKHGEFPLWNRYNSAGLPLFGQGQSQFLDPLHWIAVAGEGNGWAWDLKFLLSKLVFLAGIGACVFLMTGNRVVTITITVSAAFIGFFGFRFNHPSYFTLTYAPWVFFFYLQLLQSSKFFDTKLQVLWRWLPVSGIFFASILLLFAGTPKESTILFAALHFSGFVGIVAASLKSRKLVVNLGLLILLWVAIVLASAPHWLIFMDTLSKVSTVSDVSSCSAFSLLEDSWILIDTLFLGSKPIPWGEPNTNTFIFFGVVLAVVTSSHLFRKSGFLMTVLPLIGLLCFSFGIVPDSVCQRIPFVGKIHHVNHTFLAAAIPFLILLSAIGFNWTFVERIGVVRRFRSTFMVLLIGFLLVVLLSVKNTYSIWLINPANLLALLSIGGVTTLLLLALWTRPLVRGFSYGIATVSLALFASAHAYHGLHIESGWKELDDLIINPTPRADMLKQSSAVDFLHFSNKDSHETFLPDQYIAFSNQSELITKVLQIARRGGGSEKDIVLFEDDLRRAITVSQNAVTAEAHIKHYLRGVGVRTKVVQTVRVVDDLPEKSKSDVSNSQLKKISDEPYRVVGQGRAPMSGFYSFLHLESLNGPDALMSSRYMELLDVFGWSRKPGASWLRTISPKDIGRLGPLMDLLNVGYFLSFRNDLNKLHLVSNAASYQRLADPGPIDNDFATLYLKHHPKISVDRVSCASNGLLPDGKIDNVFSLEIQGADVGWKGHVISAMNLQRVFPSGRNHTGGHNYILGISQEEPTSPLLNDKNGEVRITIRSQKLKLWLFGCDDGVNKPGTEYVARVAVDRHPPIQRIAQRDMSIWSRQLPWPRAFFVDSFATYPEISEFARFVRQAEGVPLAAIEGNRVIEPHTDRVIVAAQNYELTSNSTSFRVEAPSSGVVVLSEVNIPDDVHVTVNNESGQVLTVNHAFRGVEILEAGDYKITFTYRPELWNVALVLSGCGLLILVMMVIIFSRNRRLRRY